MKNFLARFTNLQKRYVFGAVFLAAWLLGMVVLRELVIDLPNIDKLENYTPPLITKIYDIRGEVITELFTERRTIIPLNQIPTNLQNAFLATEDNQFFSHWGIYPLGILRAAIANVRHGRVVEGGSTITQQLSKVLFFTQEKTVTRKLRELLLALQLERNYSKEEIFQLYLNQIYFGHGAYGVEAAARTYFGKHVKELNLAESALLAGLPRSPRNYSPFTYPETARKRRAWVLSRLQRTGYITPREETEANMVPLVTERVPQAPPVGAYFVDYLRQLLEPKYGENSLYQGGYSIYTTIDLKMQKAAEEVMAKHLSEFDLQAEKERAAERAAKKLPPVVVTSTGTASTTTVKVQGALVAIDPRTGGIRALVGGREYKESQFNRAYQAQRQPGSAFKPFVWLAAYDGAMTQASIVTDDRIAFYNDGRDWKLLESATDSYSIGVATAPFPPDQVWVPQNYDFKYFGAVTLRTGLAQSRNLVAIRLAEHLGAAAVMEMAKRCGIKSSMEAVLSISLGTETTNLLELTAAYATFANGGIRSQPYGIIKIEDQNGKVLEEGRPNQSVELNAQSAYVVVDNLTAVIKEGTGRRALALGRPVAGKTGTNQDLRDLWFVGFTPDLVAGAWMGYDDFSSLGKKFTAATKVLPWWTEFMKKSLAGTPASSFNVPDGIQFAKMDSQTGYLALPSCPKIVLAAFKKGTEPHEFCPIDHAAQPIPEKEAEE